MNFLLIFIASMATGVLFSIPRSALVIASLIAASGYYLAQQLLSVGATPQEAAFAGSFAVALGAEILARQLKVPALVLSIPGIIPLVPGSVAYRATTYLVDGEELLGVETATRAGLTAVGIASGLLLASSIGRRVWHPKPPRRLRD